MALHDRGHLVVGQAGEIRRDVGATHHLDGWIGQGEHLAIALVAIHDPEALLEIHQHRDPRHALLEGHAGRRHGDHALEVLPRQDVREDIDLHRRVSR